MTSIKYQYKTNRCISKTCHGSLILFKPDNTGSVGSFSGRDKYSVSENLSSKANSLYLLEKLMEFLGKTTRQLFGKLKTRICPNKPRRTPRSGKRKTIFYTCQCVETAEEIPITLPVSGRIEIVIQTEKSRDLQKRVQNGLFSKDRFCSVRLDGRLDRPVRRTSRSPNFPCGGLVPPPQKKKNHPYEKNKTPFAPRSVTLTCVFDGGGVDDDTSVAAVTAGGGGGDNNNIHVRARFRASRDESIAATTTGNNTRGERYHRGQRRYLSAVRPAMYRRDGFIAPPSDGLSPAIVRRRPAAGQWTIRLSTATGVTAMGVL